MEREKLLYFLTKIYLLIHIDFKNLFHMGNVFYQYEGMELFSQTSSEIKELVIKYSPE